MNEQPAIGVNCAAADFRQDLIARMNNSGLPLCVVRMIFSELTGQLYQMEQKAVAQERADYKNAQQPAET